ncbi:acyl-CoA dehydrogenase family protein [Kutzneria viridogrisea]|uniref:Acyl-CoA dehydrogenase n=1 Tax=Kutzneria viridogrisea TaxID=47990 RepID=A0ABR6B7K5_9PSEU|nr:acyl-CoA dehydrogenase [Kutzneria viridogrisea]
MNLDELFAVTAEHAARTDREAAFPVEALDVMRANGMLGFVVPTEHGGGGGSVTEVLDLTLRLAREDMSVAMIFTMHCQQALALVRHANPELAARVLPRLARGELYLASVTTERGKGGHLLSSESVVHSDGSHLKIDRDAPIVTGGPHADAYLVTVLAPDATSPSQVSLVYAERSEVDVEVLGGWQPLGMRATRSVPMRLTGQVPVRNLVGEPGGFREIVTGTFGPLAHLGWSAAWLGTAAGALSRVVQFLRGEAGRKQFDTTSELLLTGLAKVRGRIDTVHSLLRNTSRVVESTEDLTQPPVQLLLNTLKITAAEQCFTAVDELIELVGLRHGYLTGSPLRLEQAFRDLRSASLNYGNQRLYLANGTLSLLDQQVRLV